MSPKADLDLDALLNEILTDAHGDEEQLWALRQALQDRVVVPCAGTVAGGDLVQITKFDFDGNVRRGLTATILRPNGSSHVIAAADVALKDSASQRYIAAYRRWMGISPQSRPTQTKTKPSRSTSKASHAPAATPAGLVEAAVLSLSDRAARCKDLSSGEIFTLRATRLWSVVPGEIVTIRPSKRWTYAGIPSLSGTIQSTRLDATLLGLTPLLLTPYGEWDPAEEYWGEPGDPIEPWAKKIIKRGRRPRFEMEQVIPGADPSDPWSDPISDSNDRKDAGDYAGAFDLLMSLCRSDLRCLDAHAHLGNLVFDRTPKDAIRHYEVGVRIGELSLPKNFNGVLEWGLIDNRPFLRCLSGYGLCLWRLQRFEEAEAVFDRMLWLNPSDNQGIRFLIDDVRQRRAWSPGE